MIRLIRTNVDDQQFQTLVIELDKDLWERYPTTQQNFAPHNKLDNTVRVVIAFVENKTVGCGAFRPIDGDKTIEIKRMYVRPEVRGRGIAKTILQELEQWGREEGFEQSKLETGNNQPEASAVYAHAGYKEIPNYPPYTDMADSICMAKHLL